MSSWEHARLDADFRTLRDLFPAWDPGGWSLHVAEEMPAIEGHELRFAPSGAPVGQVFARQLPCGCRFLTTALDADDFQPLLPAVTNPDTAATTFRTRRAIVVWRHVLGDDLTRREVLAHEMAHAACADQGGRERIHHDGGWRRCMARAAHRARALDWDRLALAIDLDRKRYTTPTPADTPSPAIEADVQAHAGETVTELQRRDDAATGIVLETGEPVTAWIARLTLSNRLEAAISRRRIATDARTGTIGHGGPRNALAATGRHGDEE